MASYPTTDPTDWVGAGQSSASPAGRIAMEGLHPDMGRLKAVLLLGFTKGVGKAFCEPAAQLADQ